MKTFEVTNDVRFIVNLGRSTAGVWEGYRPREETLAAVTPRQREILSNTNTAFWQQPVLV
jgi:hypothetical protein